jgi:hypothetical protein
MNVTHLKIGDLFDDPDGIIDHFIVDRNDKK